DARDVQHVDFSILNKTDQNRQEAVFTYYYPSNAAPVCTQRNDRDSEDDLHEAEPAKAHEQELADKLRTCDLVRLEGDDDHESAAARQREVERGQPEPTIGYGADRFTILVPLLGRGKRIHGEFDLQVASFAKAGDAVKNVMVYRDDELTAPVARKVIEHLGECKEGQLEPASFPSLSVTATVASAKGSAHARVGDALNQDVTVTNTGDVPADDTQVTLPVPALTSYATGSLNVVRLYKDLNDSPATTSSLVINLGNLRGGEDCKWGTTINRGAPDQSIIGGNVQVASAWPGAAGSGTFPLLGVGGDIIVDAPVLSLIGVTFSPVGSGSSQIQVGGAFTIGGTLVNTGHAPATNAYVSFGLPLGISTTYSSPGIGASNGVTIVQGGSYWWWCKHLISENFVPGTTRISIGFTSDQGVPIFQVQPEDFPVTIAPALTRANGCGATYDSQSPSFGTTDPFSGGDWRNSNNGYGWTQDNFGQAFTLTGIHIGYAFSDARFGGPTQIQLTAELPDGTWQTLDTIYNQQIGLYGYPSYDKTLAQPIQIIAFRLSLWDRTGWVGAGNIALYGKTSGSRIFGCGVSYDSQSPYETTTNPFAGGDWRNASNGYGWTQNDFGQTYTLTSIRIGYAFSDARFGGPTQIQLTAQLPDGTWQTLDTLYNQQIGLYGYPSYSEILSSPVDAIAFRLAIWDPTGWLGAGNIDIEGHSP
ncbi:MAG: hypothetical protein KGR26_04435, partial [Cyanobacteria bacterium REEB65]|nr:hypothetical protein [Cyanobacteria bacterium REEB65]